MSYAQNARIVGGVVAQEYSWPAQVLIVNTITGRYQVPPTIGPFFELNENFICGGTLINAYTILTAAHCITTEHIEIFNGSAYFIGIKDPLDPKKFSVYVAAYDLEKLDSYPTKKMSVKKVIRVSMLNYVV